MRLSIKACMIHMSRMSSTVAIYLDSLLEVSLFGGLDATNDACRKDDDEDGYGAGYRDNLEVWEWTLTGLDKTYSIKTSNHQYF